MVASPKYGQRSNIALWNAALTQRCRWGKPLESQGERAALQGGGYDFAKGQTIAS